MSASTAERLSPRHASSDPGSRQERWVEWMQSDHALIAAGVASFLEMTLVPIPIEAALTPAMIAAPKKRWGLAAAALLGSVACALAWYLLASGLAEATSEQLASWVGGADQLEEIRREVERDGFGYVFLAGVTPIPFQLACIAAGLAKMSLGSFALASVLARGVRYFGLAGLVTVMGEKARTWILERKWALALAMAAVGLLMFGVGSLVRSVAA